MELDATLAEEYELLWNSCTIQAHNSHLFWYVNSVQAGSDRYRAIEASTGVPWFVVGVIHGMESGFDFSCHLHNGDPLSNRTIEEPKGRPCFGEPPFSWEESAIDALNYDGASTVRIWNLAMIFFFLERYNGFGYREGKGRDTTPPCRSAYIYSGTNHYIKGKYTQDGVFDPEAISDQVGCMAQLKQLEITGVISIPFTGREEITLEQIGSISAWQHILNGCGYYPVLEISGIMDTATREMTMKFQTGVGLDVTGLLDLDTWVAGFRHKKIPGWSSFVPESFDRSRTSDGSATDSSLAEKFYLYYSNERNYHKVYDEVDDWYGTTRNACVAFASTALRQALKASGFTLERIQSFNPPDDWHDTWLITSDFSSYLISEYGWIKQFDASKLALGDIAFSDDNGENDGIPAHVYVFCGWHDESKTHAWVIDNQDFLHIRNIYVAGGGYNFTPFWYFIRPQ